MSDAARLRPTTVVRDDVQRARKCNDNIVSSARRAPHIAALLLCLVPSGLGGAQQGRTPKPESPSPAPGTPPADLLKLPPRAWVVDASANEIKAIHHEGSYLRYRVRTVDHRGDHVRDMIETKDGSVARLLLKEGRPLTPDEDKAERDRLTELAASPGAFAKHVKDDVEGKKLAADLIRLLPDAMTFNYVPGQPQTVGAPGPEVVIDYSPRAGWNPPTTISTGLRGLRGRVWIDARSHYVVHIEGEVFQTVNFGWGMLARIYPGGTISIDQRSVQGAGGPGGERWIYTRFTDDLRVRAVMVKTISVHTEAHASDFRVLSGAPTYKDGIRILLETPAPSL